ncbi:MAG: YqjF family protein [Aggregatilineales bacterium]
MQHRPWSVPQRPWVMAQSWQYLLFMHWRIAPELLRPLLPVGLTLDTYDGAAWIGVVPFLMNHVRLRGVAPIRHTSRFPELNVRTYVKYQDKPGVWFFSLDADHLPAVITARLTFNLPYFKAKMMLSVHDDEVLYLSHRHHIGANPADFIARYRPTDDVYYSKPGTLDDWLTERYALYAADRRGGLYRGEIHHLPWSLQLADATIDTNTIAAASGIMLPDDPPLLHFVRNIDVLAWSIQRLNKNAP